MDFLITQFGAVGNGKTVCTESINKAVEACNFAGGGRVVIPAGGTFVTGTIWLKSNVELYVEMGAVLLASPDMKDYCSEDSYEQNFGVPSEKWTGGHLIVALEEENISISGKGVIDGNAEQFVTKHDIQKGAAWMNFCWMDGFASALRPGQTVSIVECKGVKIEDVTFRNLPAWCLFLHGCDYVQVKGIQIFNPPYMANTDGIDIDACRYVTVSDCIIDTGDDAIAVRSSARRLKKKKNCEFVTITNCILASSSSVFRIGVGDSEIKHIRIANITANRGAVLFDYCTEYGNQPLTPIYDVNFSNVSAINIIRAVKMVGCFGVPVKNITIENIRVEAKIGIEISNEKADALEDITIRNFDLHLLDTDVKLTPEIRKERGEAIVHAKRVKGLLFDGIRLFVSEKTAAAWTRVCEIENCQNVIVKNCNL